jgi:hypothetical protein
MNNNFSTLTDPNMLPMHTRLTFLMAVAVTEAEKVSDPCDYIDASTNDNGDGTGWVEVRYLQGGEWVLKHYDLAAS